MMRVLSFLLAVVALLTFCNPIFANSSPVVSNVTASQRSDDSKLVDIFYGLADADGDSCTVWAFVSDDNGASWRVPAWAFSGDVGSGVSPGNKHISWDAASDIPGKIGDFKVRVYADDGNGTAPKVLVPGGSFPYNNTSNPDDWVYVDSFLIDKYEVTNQFYCQFLNAGGNDDHWDPGQEIVRTGQSGNYIYTVDAGKENYPIRYVSYYDAEDFCLWRSSLEGMTYRLPEHYQWQKAAAWDPSEQRFYFYGYHRDVADCGWSNFDGCGTGTTTEVGSYSNTDESQDAKSYYGCYDMSGNVQEWVYPDKICGGGFGSSTTNIKTTYYYVPGNDYKSSSAGFRCVMVPDGQ